MFFYLCFSQKNIFLKINSNHHMPQKVLTVKKDDEQYFNCRWPYNVTGIFSFVQEK